MSSHFCVNRSTFSSPMTRTRFSARHRLLCSAQLSGGGIGGGWGARAPPTFGNLAGKIFLFQQNLTKKLIEPGAYSGGRDYPLPASGSIDRGSFVNNCFIDFRKVSLNKVFQVSFSCIFQKNFAPRTSFFNSFSSY